VRGRLGEAGVAKRPASIGSNPISFASDKTLFVIVTRTTNSASR
jgi:hypothetical protein